MLVHGELKIQRMQSRPRSSEFRSVIENKRRGCEVVQYLLISTATYVVAAVEVLGRGREGTMPKTEHVQGSLWKRDRLS